MSHAATNWAVTVRGIKPGAKVVLWHLADSHNPHNGCFPSLDYLAHHAECSLSSVKNHLNEIEEAGLIKRIRMRDPKTRKQLATRYFLAFETGFDDMESNEPPGPPQRENVASRGQNLAPETGAKNDEKPGPNSAKSRGQNLAPNPVKEPVKEPSAPAGGGDPDGPTPAGSDGRAADGAAPGGPDREGGQSATAREGGQSATAREGGQSQNRDGPRGGEGAGLSKVREAAPKRGMTEREILLLAQETLMVDWIAGRRPFGVAISNAELGRDFEFDQLADYLDRFDPVAVNSVRGYIRWAHRCHHVDPEVRNPITRMRPLVDAFAAAEGRTITQIRCTKILGRRFLIDDEPEDFGKPYAPGGGNDQNTEEAA